MSQIIILSKEEINNFDLPPKFNSIQRKQYFSIDSKIDEIIERIDNPTNKIGLILIYGYFKASGRFFAADKFYDEDIEYIISLLNISKDQIDFQKYMNKGYGRHKKLICNICNYNLFNDLDKNLLFSEIDSLVSNQIRPRQIFSSITSFLELRRIEVPSYYTLANLITDRFNAYEKKILLNLENLLDDKNKKLLDDLIKIPKPIKEGEEDKKNQEIPTLSRYKLTLLKKPNHSARPGKIKESIDDFTVIKNLYQQIKPIIDELDLSVKAIKYYALWATKANVTQLTQFNNPYKRYLYLISFITHQYYFRQDLFVDMLLNAVQSAKNTVKKLEKEQYFDSKKDRTKAIKVMRESHKSLKVVIAEIKAVLKSSTLSSNEKVAKAKELLELSKSTDFPDDLLPLIEAETSSKSKDQNYYNLLETRSIKLQNRVNPIIKCLEFNDNISDKKIINAVDQYKLKDGNIDKKAPTDFLTDDEQAVIYNDKGKFRISLYKSLLFIHIANSLKSGKISLKHSYRYLSIEEYLIDLENWNKNKAELLKKAGLEEFADFDKVIKFLKKALSQQYCTTNDNILNGNNQNIKFNKDGKAIAITPKVEKEDTISATSLFSKNQPYPILQILADVDKATNFTSCFEHHNIKNAKQRPGAETFFGGIMGYGFDIGTKRIAQISKGINGNTLENTINWYFTLDSLYAANNLFAEHINNLSLSNMFLRQQEKLHTASDGQKFEVATDSLNANYSFKYGGNQKALSVYSFTDEKGRIPYNTAFSSSEREAPFVIDGLMHNDEIRSDIHSTDTHGFTETIFAATHMLGIFFAPRIKNLKKQTIYSFKENKIRDYKDKNYKILPTEYIDEDLIKENWDDILRLIVTIKLKHSTASQIFKRLSSYAKQNPLYQALKEFGRITKSLFILKYYDDLELRQAIEKQLNLVELSHKFAKAVFFGNNQEFQVESKEEQEIIVNCRRLIQNAIILWNYLYLTKLLMECKGQEKRQEMLEIILNGSIIAWGHINLHGEYDFVKTDLKASNFDLEQLLKFEVVR